MREVSEFAPLYLKKKIPEYTSDGLICTINYFFYTTFPKKLQLYLCGGSGGR